MLTMWHASYFIIITIIIIIWCESLSLSVPFTFILGQVSHFKPAIDITASGGHCCDYVWHQTVIPTLPTYTNKPWTTLQPDRPIYCVLPTNWWLQLICDESEQKTPYQSDALAVIFFFVIATNTWAHKRAATLSNISTEKQMLAQNLQQAQTQEDTTIEQ